MGEQVGDPREGVALKSREDVLRPRFHRVLLHNDNYTTMEFVVDVLLMVFHKPSDEAHRIMLNVHEQGVGVAGMYTAAVAESKVEKVNSLAQEQGFPLKCSHEPE